MEDTVIVTTCMDSRMNRRLIEMQDSCNEMHIFRDGGGDVETVEPDILRILNDARHPLKLVALTHTDCGAAKAAYDICTGGKRIDDPVFGQFVDSFRSETFKSPDDIEQLNKNRQVRALAMLKKRYESKINGIECELVNLAGIPKPNGNKTLVVGSGFSCKYGEVAEQTGLDMSGTYFVQGNYYRVKGSIHLAVNSMGIKDVRVLAQPHEYREMGNVRELIKVSGVLGDDPHILLIKLE